MTAKEIMCCNCDSEAERYVTDSLGYFCLGCAPQVFPLCCDTCFKEIDSCKYRFYQINDKLLCHKCMIKEELE